MLIEVYKALQDDTKCKQIIDFFNSFEIKDKVFMDPPFLLTGCFYSFPTKNIEYFF